MEYKPLILFAANKNVAYAENSLELIKHAVAGINYAIDNKKRKIIVAHIMRPAHLNMGWILDYIIASHDNYLSSLNLAMIKMLKLEEFEVCAMIRDVQDKMNNFEPEPETTIEDEIIIHSLADTIHGL